MQKRVLSDAQAHGERIPIHQVMVAKGSQVALSLTNAWRTSRSRPAVFSAFAGNMIEDHSLDIALADVRRQSPRDAFDMLGTLRDAASCVQITNETPSRAGYLGCQLHGHLFGIAVHGPSDRLADLATSDFLTDEVVKSMADLGLLPETEAVHVLIAPTLIDPMAMAGMTPGEIRTLTRAMMYRQMSRGRNSQSDVILKTMSTAPNEMGTVSELQVRILVGLVMYADDIHQDGPIHLQVPENVSSAWRERCGAAIAERYDVAILPSLSIDRCLLHTAELRTVCEIALYAERQGGVPPTQFQIAELSESLVVHAMVSGQTIGTIDVSLELLSSRRMEYLNWLQIQCQGEMEICAPSDLPSEPRGRIFH